MSEKKMTKNEIIKSILKDATKLRKSKPVKKVIATRIAWCHMCGIKLRFTN